MSKPPVPGVVCRAGQVVPNVSKPVVDVSERSYSVIKQTSASFVVKMSNVLVAVGTGVAEAARGVEKSKTLSSSTPYMPMLVG
jgi:hypothetical protein